MKFTFAIYLLFTRDILPSIYTYNIYKCITTRSSTASLTTFHNSTLQITNVSPLQPSVSKTLFEYIQNNDSRKHHQYFTANHLFTQHHLPNRQPCTSSLVSPHSASTNSVKYLRNNDNERYQWITNHHLAQQHLGSLDSCQLWRWADWWNDVLI